VTFFDFMLFQNNHHPFEYNTICHDDVTEEGVQGRMEYGPRALGNRSILVEPENIEMKDTINKYVKFRESWRPFAPSIWEEGMNAYFTRVYSSLYMNISFFTEEDMQAKIPAAIHIDGTARIQSVTKEKNEKYYNILSAFKKNNRHAGFVKHFI
jgi:carbamoyltransferase